MKRLVVLAGLLFVVAVMFSGCMGDAIVVSQNVSRDAENFKVYRRIVFYNGITGEYMLSIEGYSSINMDASDNQLEVTIKTGPDEYKKHFLGLSDNVTYFVEQLDSISSDPYHYKVIFKPSAIIPDIEVR